MASIIPRLVVILALLTGTGWAAAGTPTPTALWSPSAPSVPVAAAVEVTPVPSVTDEIPFIEDGRHVNSIEANNIHDGRLELQGRVDYVREKQDDVTAGNQAVARATCTDCQTIALALQLVVYQQGATNVAPRNFAIAINERCTRCLTVARAIQYVIPVPDPKDVPADVKELVKELNREMQELERIRQLNEGNVQQVDAQMNDIIARFGSLRAFLKMTGARPCSPSRPRRRRRSLQLLRRKQRQRSPPHLRHRRLRRRLNPQHRQPFQPARRCLSLRRRCLRPRRLCPQRQLQHQRSVRRGRHESLPEQLPPRKGEKG